MNTSRTPALPPQVLAAASNWFVEFNEGEVTAAQREEFVQWLRASPEHVRAYVQISAHWEEGRTLGRKEGLTVDQLMALGCSDAHALPLGRERRSLFAPDADPPIVQSRFRSRPRTQRILRIAASVLVLATSLWVYERRNVYETEIGEQRSIKLEDGSIIDLNSHSQVRVSFGSSERDVELLRGQALFSVAHDTSRPFVVHSGDTHVKAIGTRFDMYRKAAATVVTVVEGRVSISHDAILPLESGAPPDVQSAQGTEAVKALAHADPRIELSAGEQVTVTPTTLERPSAVDVAAATAWTHKQIIFRDTPLTDVVEEFNRYNDRKMRIADPAIQSIRISGAFSSTDSSSLLRALETMGVFAIHETSDEVEISGK